MLIRSSRRVRIALCALLAPFTLATGAQAHGEYDWINKGGYRNSEGVHCCGKDDCQAVTPERVQETPEGYALRDHNITVPHEQAIDPEDGKFWVCKSSAELRCFFAPKGRF